MMSMLTKSRVYQLKASLAYSLTMKTMKNTIRDITELEITLFRLECPNE